MKTKANRLKLGDVYCNGNRKVVALSKSGSWVYVTYVYKVTDEIRHNVWHDRWYVQQITTRFHVNKMIDTV